MLHTYRGANINALAELKDRFDKTKVISLDQSHRLTMESAALVNEALSHNHHDTQIKGKDHGPLPQVIAANSRNQMYQLAAQEIEKLTAEGVKPEDIAVLTRFKRSYQTFARYLDHAAIPFTLADNNDERHKLLLKFRRFLRSVLLHPNSRKALQILLKKEARLDEDTAAQLTDLTKQIPAKKLGLTEKQHTTVRKIRDAVKQARLKPTVGRALHIFAYAIQGRQDRFDLTPIQHVLRIEGVQVQPPESNDVRLVSVIDSATALPSRGNQLPTRRQDPTPLTEGRPNTLQIQMVKGKEV